MLLCVAISGFSHWASVFDPKTIISVFCCDWLSLVISSLQLFAGDLFRDGFFHFLYPPSFVAISKFCYSSCILFYNHHSLGLLLHFFCEKFWVSLKISYIMWLRYFRSGISYFFWRLWGKNNHTTLSCVIYTPQKIISLSVYRGMFRFSNVDYSFNPIKL